MSACHDHCQGETAADADYRRVLWLALAINAAMLAVEVTAGLWARSLSLQADALDFFADAATYAVTLLVLAQGARARAAAGLAKGLAMGGFGLLVVGAAAYRLVADGAPEPFIMGPVALLALGANVAVALMLYRHRAGDSNRRSVWLCSRNDAIGNIAVFAAALAVYVTSAGWPDVLVAATIAGLNLSAAWRIVRLARGEFVGLSARPASTIS
jgi:Co/Zn/Cd efflux system component